MSPSLRSSTPLLLLIAAFGSACGTEEASVENPTPSSAGSGGQTSSSAAGSGGGVVSGGAPAATSSNTGGDAPGGSAGMQPGGSAGMAQATAGGSAATTSIGGEGGGVMAAGTGGTPVAGAAAAAGAESGGGSGGTPPVEQPAAGGVAGTAGAGGQAGEPQAGGAGQAGAGGSPDEEPPGVDTESLIGWATVSGMGLDTTTGGEGGETVTVTTLAELQQNAEASGARIIQVQGELSTGTIVISSNKTVVGMPGAVLNGDIHLNDVQNIILQNLTVRGRNCSDAPDCDGGGEDAIVANGSHHIWFDHLDVSDGSDGNMDLASGSDFITVSWSKFSYSQPGRGHRFSNLVGSSDNNSTDEGHLNVTFHHNWWADNVVERMPRTRYGKVHVFNNLYTASNNNLCVLAGFEATVLLENNVFSGVSSPHRLGGGDLLAQGNVYENVSGSQEDTGVGFTPPYDYTPEDTSTLAATVMANAGPR